MQSKSLGPNNFQTYPVHVCHFFLPEVIKLTVKTCQVHLLSGQQIWGLGIYISLVKILKNVFKFVSSYFGSYTVMLYFNFNQNYYQ